MRLLKYLKFWHLPKKVWIPGLIVVIGILGYLLWPKPAEVPIQTFEVKTGEVKSLVSTSGTLEGTDSADLKFQLGGKLNNVAVKVGDTVEKGDLIASLDTQDLSIALQQAENNLRSAQAAVDKTIDDTKLFQYGNGGFGNVGTPNETQTQRSNRTAAEVTRDNAVDSVKSARQAFQDAYIYAPISGVITKADFNVGQNVSVADVIAQVVNASEYVFEAEVDESDIGKVKVGQSADVSLNSYPDQTFKATVAEIIPTTQTTDSGATVVIVKLALGKPEINFVSGVNGQADIITNQVSNVMVIPLDALMENNEVYVKRGESYEKVKVETGIQSDTETEVKSGLTVGDQVVTNPTAVKTDDGFKFPGQ